MNPLATLALLLVGHALADGPLQRGITAYKRRSFNPQCWHIALASHAAIHAGFVAIITGSLVLGTAEFFAHAGIDFLKCEKKINTVLDQSLHIACKLLWVGLLIRGVS